MTIVRTFKIHLKNGEILTLNNECDLIDYEDSEFIICKMDHYPNPIVLAVIPKSDIKYILNEEL